MVNGELHAYNQITPEGLPKITGEDRCSVDILEEVIFHWTFYLSKLNGDERKKQLYLVNICQKALFTSRARKCSVWQLGMKERFQRPRGPPGNYLQDGGVWDYFCLIYRRRKMAFSWQPWKFFSPLFCNFLLSNVYSFTYIENLILWPCFFF